LCELAICIQDDRASDQGRFVGEFPNSRLIHINESHEPFPGKLASAQGANGHSLPLATGTARAGG
jgi:hypothetical protein